MEILKNHSNLPLHIVKAVGSFITERHCIPPENTGGGPLLDELLFTEDVSGAGGRWDSEGCYLDGNFLE